MPWSPWRGALFALLALSSFACSASHGDACVADRDCGSGRRCEPVPDTKRKACVACEAEEILYDGRDNDCVPETLDADLDGDGNNAKTAAERPGTDCDDTDALTNPDAPEICADRRDNDCDGRVDEPDCGDRRPPSVRFTSPAASTTCSGLVELRVEAEDDTRVATLTLVGPLGQVLDMRESERATFRVETPLFADGPVTFTVMAEDLAHKTARATLSLILDNQTPPELVILSPATNSTHTGTVTLSADAVDGSGVRQVSVAIDGEAPLPMAEPYALAFDTTPLAEGLHTATFVAEDLFGSAATREVRFNVDWSPPTLDVTLSPASGDRVEGVFTVVVEASDPAGIALLSSQAGTMMARSEPGTGRLEYTVDTQQVPPIPNGPLVITASARDATLRSGLAGRGNERTRSVTVMVSNVPATPVLPTFRAATLRAPPGGISRGGPAVGDLNGDGIADVVTGGSAISAIFGRRIDGQYQLGPMSVLAADPATIVRLGRVDANSTLDLIASSDASVKIYLNRGDGTFQAGVAGPTLGDAVVSEMEVGDLDGDGRVDLVFGLQGLGAGDVAVSRQTAGVFGAPATFGLDGSVTGLLVANADGDSDLDILVTRSRAAVVTTFLNDGLGHLGAGRDSPLVGPATSLALGEVTGDGFPDVVCVIPAWMEGQSSRAGVEVLRGSALTPGRFVSVGAIDVAGGTVPTAAVLAQLGGSAATDLLVAVGNEVSLFWGDGAGAFAARQRGFVIARSTKHPYLADLDADGDLDLLASGVTDGAIAYARGLEAGDFFAAPYFRIDGPPTGIAAGGLVGDPLADLVVAVSPNAASPSRVLIYENRGASGWSPRPAIPLELTRPRHLALGDLDATPGLDIAVGSDQAFADMGSSAVLLYNDGVGRYLTSTRLDLDRPIDVGIGDIDADARGEAVFTQDFAEATMDDGAVVFEASSDVPAFDLRAGRGALGLALGDLDRDGTTDVAVANAGTHDITVNFWSPQGTGDPFTTATFDALPGLSAITVGRVAGDAINDLIGVGARGIMVMEGDPVTGFAAPLEYPAGEGPTDLQGGDFNRDGILDVLVINPTLDLGHVLMGNPLGGFLPPMPLTTTIMPVGIAVADYDLDGRPDVAVAAERPPTITIFFGNGDTL